MKEVKIAINGFGRIGRSFFRAAFGEKDFDIVAVNDLADTATLVYLLKYDSVYGRYDKEVKSASGELLINGNKVKVLSEKDPRNLPWKEMGVDLVIESTGLFTSGEKAKAHLDAGARRVVITAPASGDVPTLLVGVNDEGFSAKGGPASGGKNLYPITSNASCTTNSVAPVMQILIDNFGIEKAGMVTVHGYTASQKLVDAPDEKDLRRGRAAAVNIVPSTTGAAEAVIKSIPELEGKFDAVAMRVPIIAGSISAITALLGRPTSKEEVNEIFKNAAQDLRWSKVLAVTEDPIVSTDVIGEPYGAIVDLALTKVVDRNLVEVFSWYDNEAGYTATLVEHVRRVVQNI